MMLDICCLKILQAAIEILLPAKKYNRNIAAFISSSLLEIKLSRGRFSAGPAARELVGGVSATGGFIQHKYPHPR